MPKDYVYISARDYIGEHGFLDNVIAEDLY